LRYLQAKKKAQEEELAYRVYVSDALFYYPQNKGLTVRYYDLIFPKKEDTRTGDEIALSVISRLGLKVE